MASSLQFCCMLLALGAMLAPVASRPGAHSLGNGAGCADASATASATAEAVATAIAEAISASSNGCAAANAAVKAEDIQRKVASAVATSAASACSTATVSSPSPAPKSPSPAPAANSPNQALTPAQNPFPDIFGANSSNGNYRACPIWLNNGDCCSQYNGSAKTCHCWGTWGGNPMCQYTLKSFSNGVVTWQDVWSKQICQCRK
ncbi:hypothetical protein OEZ85_007162 [Tetradesmus obliquus]|uniref:EGF-like domain-containing protein n=1 Tax=Tetradesmus obliquus TaxID=3088 RepID=A0ABY8TZC2_TETOB|nr:hypothetical protein OEZ85_007162 [Tetradesmus obliquus]